MKKRKKSLKVWYVLSVQKAVQEQKMHVTKKSTQKLRESVGRW